MSNDENPKLTIGIPTYNGADTLSAAIESALSQSRIDEVEILISDNCSEDETGAIVKDFQNEHPGLISYYRNETNVGYDANVDLVVNRAKGEFVWILSDDDELMPGAVVKVLDEIGKHENIAFMFANYSYFHDIPVGEDHHCANGNDYYLISDFKNSLVSSNIVNRKCWASLDMKRYIGCLWIHIAYTMEALAPPKGNGAIIFKEPMVKMVGKMKWGKNGSFIFTGFRFVDVYSNMKGLGYDKKVQRKALKAIEGAYYFNIPIAVAMGLKVDRGTVRQFAARFKGIPSFWCIDLPLLLVPRPLYLAAYKAYSKITGKRPIEL